MKAIDKIIWLAKIFNNELSYLQPLTTSQWATKEQLASGTVQSFTKLKSQKVTDPSVLPELRHFPYLVKLIHSISHDKDHVIYTDLS